MEKTGSRTPTPPSSPRTIEKDQGTPSVQGKPENEKDSVNFTARPSQKAKSTEQRQFFKARAQRPPNVSFATVESEKSNAGDRVVPADSDMEIQLQDAQTKVDQTQATTVKDSSQRKSEWKGRKSAKESRNFHRMGSRGKDKQPTDPVAASLVPIPVSTGRRAQVDEAHIQFVVTAKVVSATIASEAENPFQRYINAIYFALGGPANEEHPEFQLHDVQAIKAVTQDPNEGDSQLIFAKEVFHQMMSSVKVDSSALFLGELAFKGGVSAMRQWCEGHLGIPTTTTWFTEVREFYELCVLRDDPSAKSQHKFPAVGMDDATKEKFQAIVLRTIGSVLANDPNPSSGRVLSEIKLAIVEAFGLEVNKQNAERPYWQVACLAAKGMQQLGVQLKGLFENDQLTPDQIKGHAGRLLRAAENTSVADHEILRLLDRTPQHVLKLWSQGPQKILEDLLKKYKINSSDKDRVYKLTQDDATFMSELRTKVTFAMNGMFSETNATSLPVAFCKAFCRLAGIVERTLPPEYAHFVLSLREREIAFASFGMLWREGLAKYPDSDARHILLQKITKEFADGIKKDAKACGYENFTKRVRQRAEGEAV